jgi:predicted nucleic acid-binding protein
VIALLDTNILIASKSETEPAPDLSGFDDLMVSSLSWSELIMGLHTTKSLSEYKRRARRLGALQDTYGDGLPYDDACIDTYNDLLERAGQRGGDAKAKKLDRMIAATAMAHELVLVTRNVNDFRMFDGMLDVVER